MCAVIHTMYDPQRLLHRLLHFEKRCDRLRGVHWMDRTLDLDILLYAQSLVDTTIIQVPHPRMLERSFVMEPAIEIAGDWIHPNMQIELQDCPSNSIQECGRWVAFPLHTKNRM